MRAAYQLRLRAPDHPTPAARAPMLREPLALLLRPRVPLHVPLRAWRVLILLRAVPPQPAATRTRHHESTATSAGSTRNIGSRTTRPPTRTKPALIARRARTISPTTGATTSSNRNTPTAGDAARTTRRSPLAADEPSTRPVGGTGSFAPRPGERSGASPLPPAPPTARTSSTASSSPSSIARRTNVPRFTPVPSAAPSNRPPRSVPNLIVNRGSSLVGMKKIMPPGADTTGQTWQHPPHTHRRDPLLAWVPSSRSRGWPGVPLLAASRRAIPARRRRVRTPARPHPPTRRSSILMRDSGRSHPRSCPCLATLPWPADAPV